MEMRRLLLLIFVCLSILLQFSNGDLIAEDKKALLNFAGASHGPRLKWAAKSPACGNWVGVYCSSDEGRVVGLHLPGVGLTGDFPANTLSRLTSLRVLSLRNNAFTGPFPADLLSISTLTRLNLHHNNFSGPLPKNFAVWSKLVVLDLSNNSFSGEIHESLNLPSLRRLSLADNKLTGTIPDFLLHRFPASSFAGNDLFTNVHNNSTPPLPSQRKNKKNHYAFIGIMVGACILIIILIAVFAVYYNRRKHRVKAADVELGETPPENKTGWNPGEDKKEMVLFGDCNLPSDVNRILAAPGKTLGKGTYGTSAIAYLNQDETETVVIKRLIKDVELSKEEFEQQMEIVGRVRHQNIVPLIGYYNANNEKLLFYNYCKTNLSVLLHGSRVERKSDLDWYSRARIAIGTARAIAHIHSLNLIHGNIKPTNIFMDAERFGCLSDLGFAALIRLPDPQSTAYGAPELADPSIAATQASDVYSFGVVMLELLTGKFPVHTSAGGETVRLVEWVPELLEQERTGEVFDSELMRYRFISVEIVCVLEVVMHCVKVDPQRRPTMAVVVSNIEGICQVQ